MSHRLAVKPFDVESRSDVERTPLGQRRDEEEMGAGNRDGIEFLVRKAAIEGGKHDKLLRTLVPYPLKFSSPSSTPQIACERGSNVFWPDGVGPARLAETR